jgi:FAD:protein FMN transferase
MPSPSNSLRRARPLLGTIIEIRAAGDPHILPGAVGEAFALIERVQKLMSFHDGHSDVSRINSADTGSEICVDPHTWRVLEFARQLGDLSAGAFDIATAAVLVQQGFLPKHLSGAMPSLATTYRDLELTENYCVRWKRKGWIDLGGIAKGYAVDRAIEVLQSRGINSAVVNAGGDMRCFGEAQPVQVRQPDSPASLLPLGWLSDHALATSAGYFSGIEEGGKRIEPLVDAAQRSCTTWGGSVSVVAAECMIADALTKVAGFSPENLAEILASYNAQAIHIHEQKMRTCGSMLLQQEAII